MQRRRVGPLLRGYLDRAENESPAGRMALAAHLGGEPESTRVPAFVQYKRMKVRKGERWADYRERVRKCLVPRCERLNDAMGVEATPLIAANAVQLSLRPEQVSPLSEGEDVRWIELDVEVRATLGDPAPTGATSPSSPRRGST